MIDEHPEEQNPSSNSPPECSADKDSGNEYKDDDSIPRGPQNGFDPFPKKSNPEGVIDIVRTIENSLYRIIDDNFDHLANPSSNTLGMIVKDSLILKAKQSDKKEVPFDGLKTSLASVPIIDDDLPIGFSPEIDPLGLGSDSENLSTKRKKSVSLADEVKVFKGIENEFFADNEGGFCSELIDNHSDKVMDREKSATGNEDGTNDFTRQKIHPQRSGNSFISHPNTSRSTEKNLAAGQCQEISMKITEKVVKKSENASDHRIPPSLLKLILNVDEALQDNSAQNSTTPSAPGENQSIVSLVETEARISSSKLNQSFVFGDESTQVGSRVDERIKLSTDDEVEADEVYGKEEFPDTDENASDNENDDNGKIKVIRKLMNEFLSGLRKPSEDRVPLNLESTQLSEETREQSAIEIPTSVSIEQSQQAFELINPPGERIPIVNRSDKEMSTRDEDIQNADSYVRRNISGINQVAREFLEKSDNGSNTVDDATLQGDEINSVVEKSHSSESSSKINDQLLADARTSGTLGNSEIDVKDVTETSETSEVGRNDGMKFPNNGQLEELKLREMENDIKSTFGIKIESSTNDPLSRETLTKVSLNTDDLSEQSSRTDYGTNRQPTTDLSLKQTSSTVSRDGSKSSRKSSGICTSDIMRPDPNNLIEKTFPVFAEDENVLKQTEFTVALKAEGSLVNLVDQEYEDGEGNGEENAIGALAVIEVSVPSFNDKNPSMQLRKDIKWEERDKLNAEEASPRKSKSIESEGTLQYSSESRTSETGTRSHSSVLFKSEPAVIAYLATPSAAGYRIENERLREGSSDSEPSNTPSNLKSIFRSLNETKSEKRSVAGIRGIENNNIVKISSRTEIDLVGIELIKSTKSLQDDRNRIQDKRTKGHKLLDDPPGIDVQQSCRVAHNDFERNENEEKSEDSVVANGEAKGPEESVDKSIARKVASDEDKVDVGTAKVSEKKMKMKRVRKSEESAKKFANSLSRIFNSSSSRRNCDKESGGAITSRSSAEDDSYIQEQNSCLMKTRKSEVTDNNGEELVAVKSLDSLQDQFKTHKESIQEFRKSSEKVYATKGTIVSYPLKAENPKHDRSIDDFQPMDKSQKKSSRKSFAGLRKLFSGASTRNKRDPRATEDQVDHKSNEDSVVSARASSVTSVERSADDAEKSSLLSMAKSYIRRRSEIRTEGRRAVKRVIESSGHSITLSSEDQKKTSKERGSAKTETMFSRGIRRLFKKKSSVIDSVASIDNGARDYADDLNQSSEAQDFSQTRKDCSEESWEPRNSEVKEKSDLEQLVYGAITEPAWKDVGSNESESTVPLLRITEKKSDRWPDGESKSRNRCTISDDDCDDIETSSNLKVSEKLHTAEIRFMEQDEPENKTGNLAQKQRLSEIVSNVDFRPLPSFAGRRSTIVMMAAPMAPREEANPQESSRSNQARDEPSSSPTVFYYLLGPSLDEALIDVRVIFQNLIDKIIGRRG